MVLVDDIDKIVNMMYFKIKFVFINYGGLDIVVYLYL